MTTGNHAVRGFPLSRKRGTRVVLLLVLFLAAFIPRALYPVSRPLQWYERGFRFVDAILHGQWADTVFSEHPGVTSMWLIGLAQHGYYALITALGGAGFTIEGSAAAPPHPLDTVSRAFQTEVAVSVLPLAAVLALGVLACWWLLRELFGEDVAWAGAGLLALDPFHIAISKVVHVDALLSELMLLSALTLLVHLRRSGGDGRAGGKVTANPGGQWFMCASGVLAGLAFLTKSPAYFLVPFLGLSLLVMRGRTNLWRGYLAPMLIWVGAAAVTYVVLWPAMWVEPGQALQTVIDGVVTHLGRAHPHPLHYLGELTTEDPGLGYYGITLLVKTTVLSLPLFVVGLVSPLTAMWRRDQRTIGPPQSLVLMIAYFGFFVIQMGLGAKKMPRYLLPAFAALDVIAGVGLATLARRMMALLPRPMGGRQGYKETRNAEGAPAASGIGGGSWVAVFIGVVLAVQAALVWPYHPYYVTHANLLVGGSAGARQYLLSTPEGEGLDLVAEVLNRLPAADQLRVGVQWPAQKAFSQYFVGEVLDTGEPDLDYLVFADIYVRRGMAEDRWKDQWETYKYQVPEYTAEIRGIPYAWLYKADDSPQRPAVPLQVCVGEDIRLQGYTLLVDGASLDAQAVHPGDSLRLTLHWIASEPPERYYDSVFVHLLGPDGSLVVQQDNPPQGGAYPTFLWKPGERVDDPYELKVPPDAPSGSYVLTVGMYDWRTGERLAALDTGSASLGARSAPPSACTSRLPEDRIVLTTFEVEPAGVAWWQVLAWILAGTLIVTGIAAARPEIAPIRSWLERWWIPLAYLLLTLLMTYPVLLRLGTHYIGFGTDMWMFPWNDWWCRKCLLEGLNPFYTNRIFYPHGISTVYHNFAWLNTAMWIPLSPLIGPIAAHNVIFLFNIAVAGVSMHMLVHYLIKDHRAALLAGIVFAFWPYRMSHFNHPNMICIGLVPLCVLYLFKIIWEGPKLKFALLGGLFFALTGLARWMHLMYTSGMLFVCLAYSLLFERRYWSRRTVVALVLMFGFATVLVAPLLSPLVLTQIRGGERADDVFIEEGDFYGTDLLSYFVPERGHPLFRPKLEDLWGQMKRGAYLGYTVLALAGVGLIKGRRGRVLWFVVGAGLFVFALGGNLQVAGRSLDVALPYSWVEGWDPVRVMRHPHRLNLLLGFPLAVLVGYGATWLLARLKRPVIWSLGLGMLILIEYLPWPYPMSRPDIPPFYQELARETDDFAVLDLPLGASTAAKLYMYYSTIHGKALVGGRVARLPRSAFDLIDSVPVLRGLRVDEEMDPDLGDVSRQLSALAQANVRYVILHPAWVTPDRLARWQKWLAVPPMYEDQYTVVYQTAPEYGRDFSFSAAMGDGIGVITTTLSGPTHPLSQTLGIEVVWGAREAPQLDWQAEMALVNSGAAEVRRLEFAPTPGWPTSEWGENAVARGRVVMPLDAHVEPGTYTVTLTLVDPATGVRAAEPVVVGQVQQPPYGAEGSVTAQPGLAGTPGVTGASGAAGAVTYEK